MDKDSLIKITNEIYRVTLLFPKKEPLRYKMREIADEIFARCLAPDVKHNSGLEDFEILDGFFEVAKNQNWVKKEEIINLQKEYIKLREDLEKIENLEVKPLDQTSVKFAEVRPRMNERQKRILEFLKENGRAQVWQIKEILPEVSKRTLRRDFKFLLKLGKIERVGEKNATFYQLSTNYNY